MADDTPHEVRSLVIYQVFPRVYGPTGRLSDITADLDRIAALGVDVLFLMPIHPIGEVGRKGSLGSPYAIRDYRAVHPDLGTDEEFDELVAAAHAAGLRVILDVVFNHTSPDSVLVAEHPEFFHQDADGVPYTTVPAWHDVIDLKHPHPQLTRYLIDSLAGWVRRGVDGFRCDVASLVPAAFWVQARAELAALRPGLLWLAETVHPSMVEARRAQGIATAGDGELYAAFDIEYQYDLWSVWQAVVVGSLPVGRFLEMLRWQDATLPGTYAKLRFVENHDQYRVMHFAPSRDQALAWTTVMACARGPLMVYAGQESGARRWPSLFEPDPVDWGGYELTGFVRALAGLTKHPAQLEGQFWVLADEPCVQLAWGLLEGDLITPVPGGPGLYVVANVAAAGGEVAVQLPDGEYRDRLGGGTVTVRGGTLPAPAAAVVLEFAAPFTARRWQSPLLDVFLHVEVLGEE
ncbi:MAG TPA: alpha-amylase family glycosyl hydrolase [Actinotalea sp.]|nr:alpha-amylase family glycosyl hydrolase [Actinotalea sp.]